MCVDLDRYYQVVWAENISALTLNNNLKKKTETETAKYT